MKWEELKAKLTFPTDAHKVGGESVKSKDLEINGEEGSIDPMDDEGLDWVELTYGERVEQEIRRRKGDA